MMVNLQIKKVFTGMDYKLQVATQIINFLIVPFIGFFIAKLFFPDNPLLILGLLLASLLPTSGMTISWTGFSKGNMNAAVKMTVIGLIIGSLATPLYANFLMGETIAIPMSKIFKQIAVIVFLPMILGYGTQRFLIKKFGEAKYHKDLKSLFPPFSTLGVLGIVFTAMALKSQSIYENPFTLLSMLLPLAILYIFNFSLSTFVGKYFFNREDGIALVYGTVMRNLSIALAIAMAAFGREGSEIAIVVAMAYIIQVQAAAWYVKLSPKFFGPTPEDRASDIRQEGIFSLPESATLKEAARLLDEEHIHSIAVLSKNQKPRGIITESMIVNSVAEEQDINSPLEKLELKPIVSCKYNAPIEKIIRKMRKAHNYKIVVVDEKGNFTGILTESDIMKNIAG
jgi:ACR3 family arsenite efflux pump ArsB/CBS domain-containing protein